MENNKSVSLLEILNLQLFAEDDDKDNEEENLDEDDFDDSEEDKEKDKEPSGKENEEETKKKQSREENTKFAQLRREKEQKEREEKLKKEAYVKGQLDSTKTNTFTGQPIEDEYDLKIFQLQQKIKANGGDPIEDLPKELARIDRENALDLRKKQEEELKQKEKTANDIKEFKTQFPKVDAVKLLEDPTFKKYCIGRIDKDSLVDIYKDYQEMKKVFVDEYKAKLKEKEALEKAKNPPPSADSISGKNGKSYLEMTREERIQYLKATGQIK